MAAVLGSEILLTTINPDTFLGISPGSSKGEVIVSHSDSVVVIEVDSQKPVSSWNVSGGEKALKVAAAFDYADGVLLAGLANGTLRKWSPAVDRITQGQNVRLSSSLISIWSDKRFPEVLLVNCNGSIDQLTELQRVFTSPLPKDEAVRFLKVFKEKGGVHLTYISSNLTFHHIFISKNTLNVNYSSGVLTPAEEGLFPKDVCIIADSKSMLHVYILWSDGYLRAGTITPAGLSTTWVDLFCVEAGLGIGEVSLQVFGDHFLIAAANETPSATCMLYNIKFRVLSSSMVIDRSEPVRKVQLHAVGDIYLLQLDSDILLLTYHKQNTTLSGMLGVKSEELNQSNGLTHALRWTKSGLKTDRREAMPISQMFSSHFLEKVGQLENTGKSDHVACDVLLREFLQNNNFDSILEVFNYYRHLPESCVVETLQAYLSAQVNCEEILKNELFQRNEKPERHPFLDQILSVQFNVPFMRNHVQKLSTEQVLFLVWYLACFLDDANIFGQFTSQNASSIVDWMSILVDTHFKNILLKSNSLWVSSLLRSLLSIISDTCKHVEELTTLREIISSLLTRRMGRKRFSRNVDYYIETLFL